MLDQLIHEKACLVTYNEEELSNIPAALDKLKNITGKQSYFNDPFIGGSYKRGTLVKGVSDVDVFIHFTGKEAPGEALNLLKLCLEAEHPKTFIKQDQPAVMVRLGEIPFKITLYRKDAAGSVSISDDFMMNWKPVDWRKLEDSVIYLGKKNPRFIDLIKVLKLWNYNYKQDLMNAAIEERVCKLFMNNPIDDNLPEMMWTFFNRNRFQPVANRVLSLMRKEGNQVKLKQEWLRFIDNRQ